MPLGAGRSLRKMMGGRGVGRGLVLLVSLTTLLLIFSSAVSGDSDEDVREVGRFAGRFGREDLDGGAVISDDGKGAGHVTEELKEVSSSVVVKEKKPEEGIVEKARSFLSGVATSIRNVIPNPASFLVARENLAAPSKGKEKSSGLKGHLFGRRHGLGHSRWAKIRDSIRSHPERIAAAAAADLSATEFLALGDHITTIVMSVVEDYDSMIVAPNFASTCADALENEVKIFLKSVKSALRERLCNADAASMKERQFCILFNDYPMTGTFLSLWMAHVDPVKVSWHQISRTTACDSVNPSSSFLDSLQQMERLAHHVNMLLPEGIVTEDKEMDHDHEHKLLHRQRHEHGDNESHWWQRMLHTKPRHREVHEHGVHKVFREVMMDPYVEEHDEHGHGDNERHWWQRMFHLKPHHDEVHEHGDQKMSLATTKDRSFEEHREHGKHEKHSWQQLFEKFSKYKNMRHFESEHALENFAKDDCLFKGVKYLDRGIKQRLATVCQSATSMNVIAACNFAKEHRVLIKAWLAVKAPVWIKAAKGCARTSETWAAFGNDHVGTSERKGSVDGEILASSEAGKTNERQLSTLPPWVSKDRARHRASGEFSKTLHLRGHVIGINLADTGLRRLVRTHLVILGGHPLDMHDFQEAFENLLLVDHVSSGELLANVQERVTEFVGGLVTDAEVGEHQALPGIETEIVESKPLHQHPSFRISANPRVVSKVPQFRISAMPRTVGDANRELPVVGQNDGVEDVAGGVDADPEIKFHLIPETAERKADM